MSKGFLPCPICGRELSEHDLRYFDCEGEITEFDHVRDFDHIADPSNMCLKEVWDEMEDGEKAYLGEDYKACVEQVEYLSLQCSCGYSFGILRDDTCFPESGWVDEFRERANRRGPPTSGCQPESLPDLKVALRAALKCIRRAESPIQNERITYGLYAEEIIGAVSDALESGDLAKVDEAVERAEKNPVVFRWAIPTGRTRCPTPRRRTGRPSG